ncbi:unnamed protein product [Musa acuminata subsp. malaccensis]|nr:PREDICTED: transcription factor MYB23-like [Musa acuminata subsp. malaccensis]CAG1861940.1 unnamed protein product [Musa acuminata subsp. malaccensis]
MVASKNCLVMGCKACEKPKVSYKKGLWSPDEDQRLRDFILKHGHGCWSSVPARAGLQRNGKSCRLRWINYLRPGLKHSDFTPEEEGIVMKLHTLLGNKWSQIAMHLPGRTDNEVKNHWNTHLKKKLVKIEGSSSHASMTKSLESDSQCPKLEKLIDENSNQISLSESSDSLKSVSPTPCRSIHVTNHAPFPKILFADWLPMFRGNDQSSSAPESDRVNWQQESTLNSEVLSPKLMQFDTIFTEVFLHGFEDASICGGFKLQFEPVEQIFGFHDQAYTGLELNHDMFVNL